ncbi:siderophore-interacting protein [Puniceibacterium sediminis]|uniref:NADPH-dependent ferric siderophore reductase, contains FAD-binding and SIP domains n=1 Tax=Puniceibacterium sediminis TaxID=1608407 RepID=A0A238YR08_9RHOB|nr:siderophore-interacting protein [Puniceibacterium sediminis]SNR73412.1 NADPH-dependent ferric siderophore reductase, contains FAD-binding and SIP domains [Puniceibacterium sediminis]
MNAVNNSAKPAKRAPRLLTVKAAWRITPNMIRVTLHGADLHEIAEGCEGANCKLFLPTPGQPREDFATQLEEGPRPTTRTYTVRYFRKDLGEIDIDFVAHGDNGPASAWAGQARPGDFCGFAGPGPVKLTSFHADWFLLAADMSAIPVVAATLEAMPRDSIGVAIFEVLDEADRQPIAAPPGVVQHWIVTPESRVPSLRQEQMIRDLNWPTGRVQTCIAGESSVIQGLRRHLQVELGLPREDTYISGYWKIGLVEDEHQNMKRQERLSA